jgi:hypothetical protein
VGCAHVHANHHCPANKTSYFTALRKDTVSRGCPVLSGDPGSNFHATVHRVQLERTSALEITQFVQRLLLVVGLFCTMFDKWMGSTQTGHCNSGACEAHQQVIKSDASAHVHRARSSPSTAFPTLEIVLHPLAPVRSVGSRAVPCCVPCCEVARPCGGSMMRSGLQAHY